MTDAPEPPGMLEIRMPAAHRASYTGSPAPVLSTSVQASL